MQRRLMLTAAAGIGLALSTRLYAAAPAVDSRFLLVFLRGGYDAANLLVPVSSDFYYASRPQIAIPRPAADAPDAALPVTADWGLHPALRQCVYPLIARGQAAFIPFAGTDDVSRSHFETQDGIELGQTGTARNFQSGFLNRLAQVLGTERAIAFTDQLPLSCQGQARIGNVSLKNPGRSGVDPRTRELLDRMYQGQPLESRVQEGFALRDAVTRELQDPAASAVGEQTAANRNAITARGFEAEARRVARLMRERYALGFIDIGGWDTHVNQGAGTGYLANRFEELGRGLAGLAEDMGPAAWQKTNVVVLSEFGRTFRENGNRGTDHGHGSVYWVLGGGLSRQGIANGVAGEQVALRADTLFQNRDYPVLNDYRAVLGGLFQRQFGLSAAAAARVFPGTAPRDLGLL